MGTPGDARPAEMAASVSRAPLRVAPRRARDVALPAFYAGDLALIGFGMAVFSNTWFDRLVRATGGLVTDTLLVNLVGIPLLVGGIALGLGRLRPTDIGLRRADLPLALVVLLALWLATQAVALALAWTTGSVVPHPSWAHRGTLGVLGLLLAQVLGNGLLEEIGYRGFLLPQLHHRLGRVVAPRFRLAAAVAVSQALFAAAHAPNRVREGVAGAALVGSVLIPLALGSCSRCCTCARATCCSWWGSTR
jgi:membrane protease YdiL (CAAX protease family)